MSLHHQHTNFRLQSVAPCQRMRRRRRPAIRPSGGGVAAMSPFALPSLLFLLLMAMVCSSFQLSHAQELVDHSLIVRPVTTAAPSDGNGTSGGGDGSALDEDEIDALNAPYMHPAMRNYRALFKRDVVYDTDAHDEWGSEDWVYNEFDMLFDVFSENRVQRYLQLLAAATGFDVSRIVPIRNTVGSRGLAYGFQTLFSVRLEGALPKQQEVTWPPGYVPPSTTAAPTTSPLPTASTLATTTLATTAGPSTTNPPTTTEAPCGGGGNGTNVNETCPLTNESTAIATTTNAPTTTTTPIPTTTGRTTTTTRPPRTLAPMTTPVETPAPTVTTTAAPTQPGHTTTLPPGFTTQPADPQPGRHSDAFIFVNAVLKEISDLRSDLSKERLVSIRKVYRVHRTVETIYVGVDYVWVCFIVFAVLTVFLSAYLVLRNRPQQEQEMTDYSPSEGAQNKEGRALNANDALAMRRELERRMAGIHQSRIDHSKAEGLPMPLTQGKFKREQFKQYLRDRKERLLSGNGDGQDPLLSGEEDGGGGGVYYANDLEREQDAIKAAYHHPHFTSVAQAFAEMDAAEAGGDGAGAGGGGARGADGRMSKAEASEAAKRAAYDLEEKRRNEKLPLVQMLMHDQQFALPYSPMENAERKAQWLRELRQRDAAKGKSFLMQQRRRRAEAAAAAAAAATAAARDAKVGGDDDATIHVNDLSAIKLEGLGSGGDDDDDDALLGRNKMLSKEDLSELLQEGETLEMLEHFDEFELDARRTKLAIAKAERAKEAAMDEAIANKINAVKTKKDELQELLDTDPLRINRWREANQPGKYEYRQRNKLELFDQTRVHRAFEEDVRKGGWKKPTDHRMVSVGLGDYDDEGNFVFTERKDDDPLLLNPQYDHVKAATNASSPRRRSPARKKQPEASGLAKLFAESRPNRDPATEVDYSFNFDYEEGDDGGLFETDEEDEDALPPPPLPEEELSANASYRSLRVSRVPSKGVGGAGGARSRQGLNSTNMSEGGRGRGGGGDDDVEMSSLGNSMRRGGSSSALLSKTSSSQRRPQQQPPAPPPPPARDESEERFERHVDFGGREGFDDVSDETDDDDFGAPPPPIPPDLDFEL